MAVPPPSDETLQENLDDTNKGRAYLPPLVGCALIGLIIAFVIGLKIFGVISGLIFPKDAPLPQPVTEIQHEHFAYGSDQWTYQTSLTPCEVIAFYQAQGGVCLIQQAVCGNGTYTGPAHPDETIATCTGTDTFSIFGLQWEAVIYTRYFARQETTEFTLKREVLWNGLHPTAEPG